MEEFTKMFRVFRSDERIYGMGDKFEKVTIEITPNENGWDREMVSVEFNCNHSHPDWGWYGLSWSIRHAEHPEIFKFTAKIVGYVRENRLTTPKAIIEYLEKKKFTWVTYHNDLERFIDTRKYSNIDMNVYELAIPTVNDEHGTKWEIRRRLVARNEYEGKRTVRKWASDDIAVGRYEEVWSRWLLNQSLTLIGEAKPIDIPCLEAFPEVSEEVNFGG